MMFRTMWVFYLFFTGAYMHGCHGQEVILSSDTLDQWENMSITLTCFSSLTNPTGTFSWYLNDTKSELLISYVTKDCQILSSWLANNESYIVTCTNRSVNSVTIKTISQTRHGEKWNCKSYRSTTETASNTVQILVKVPVKLVTITPYQSTLTTTENTTVTMTCASSECRPEPKFRWYIKHGIMADGNEQIVSESNPSQGSTNAFLSYSNTFAVKLNRTWNGMRLYCGAQNNVDYIMSQIILLNITYPPDGNPRIGNFINGSTLSVIKDSFVELECSVSGGNPLPILSWNINNDITQTVSGSVVTKGIRWQANEFKRDALICQSTHPHRTYITVVPVNVLYPPDDLKVDLTLETGYVANVTRYFSLIEHTSKSIILGCIANSNPSPNVYSWNGPFKNSSETLVLNLTREFSGSYQCTATNTMMPTNNAPEIGRIQKMYTIDILYPPKVSLTYRNAYEGQDVIISCVQTPGKITHQSILWTSHHTSLTNNNSLIIRNATRKHAGNFTCLVSYTMIPTYGESKSESIIGVVYLDVFYATNDGQNSPSVGGNAGQVAGGVIGGLVGIGAIITAVFLVRKRLHAKQLNAANNSCDLNLSQVCQYESKENNCTVTADSDTAHVYEKLQNAGSDRHYQQLTSIASKEKKDDECTETKDGGKSKVYEKLHAAGQNIVYENLRIQRDAGKRNAEDELQ